MSTKAPLPRYIPPPTTFLLSRSGVALKANPLPNRHWNKVRTNVKNNGLQFGNRSGYDGIGYGSEPKWAPIQGTHERTRNQINAPQARRQSGGNRQNGEPKRNEQQGKKFQNGDGEEVQVIQKQQLHYAQPDISKIFDEADKKYEDKEEDKYKNAGPKSSNSEESSYTGENGTPSAEREDYDDDVDWQKKTDRDDGEKYDWLRNKRRSSSVYDPEATKIRAQEIDQTRRGTGSEESKDGRPLGNGVANGDMRGKSRRKGTSKTPEMGGNRGKQENENTSNSEEEQRGAPESIQEERDFLVGAEFKGDEEHESTESAIEEDDEKSEDENENVKEGKGRDKKQLFKNLHDTIKKCTSKFAEKLLDALEQQKSDCLIHFDDICKKHKKKNSEPIFTSYSCENGDTTKSFRDTVKKKVQGLVSGVYTKACESTEAIRSAAEELMKEIKPHDDGSWSQIGGENGVRCVPHYDNRIEDHTIYVCSCCFNEVIERDAHVNVKYFDAEFGCCKPKFVSRSFENRPYFCEKLLASMSQKRRSCFLKMYGKKHHMRGGVHCISVIPSMEEEYLAREGKSQSCDGEDNCNGSDTSRVKEA